VAATITQDQWEAVRAALRETGERFAEVVRAAPDAGAKATRHWSVAETAAHVGALALLDTSLVKPGGAPLAIPLDDQLPTANVDAVGGLNKIMLRHYTEREPGALAERLRADVDHILTATAGEDGSRTVDWLGGSRVPLAGLLAHLLNELLIHGRDIAKATRAPWVIPPEHAAMFFELFLVGTLHSGVGRLLETTRQPPRRRISVEFRSRYLTPVVLVLDNGRLTAEEPAGPTDVRVSFDPAVLALMMFRRIRGVGAVLTRKVVIGGRRPWLLPVFLRNVRMP
jgi:hypothetical protein